MKRKKLINVNSERTQKVLTLILFLLLLISAVFCFVMMLLVDDASGGDQTRSDYLLTFVQSVLGIVVMLLPTLLRRKWQIVLPGFMYTMFLAYLYAAVFLGEMRNYYHRFHYWDSLLHMFSGAMLGALGFSVVCIFNDEDCVDFHLTPAFVALFAFCFAFTLGGLWEIYEFAGDSLLDINMQRYRTMDGQILVGQAALRDTMKDLIIDAAGAALSVAIGYLSIKRGHRTLRSFSLGRGVMKHRGDASD